MNITNEILDAIEIIVNHVVEDNTTKIYSGVCKTVATSTCVLTINGKDNTVKYYGGAPLVGSIYQVFVPFGNMSAAFIIVPGGGGETPETGVSSVNGKTGSVILNANDVGALPSTTVIPTKTSELENDSGFVNGDALSGYAKTTDIPTKTSEIINDSGYITTNDIPVKSVNGKTGAVVLTQDDVSDGQTYVRTHNDFTDVAKQQISTNEDNIAMAESDIEGLQTDVGALKTDVGQVKTTLNSKQDTITGGASTITDNNLTANHALVSNGSGKVEASTVTSTELGYLGGVTSKVQTQLNKKLEKVHDNDIAWGGKNLSGEVSPTDAAMVPVIGGNKFALCKPQGIVVEYTNDGGATWENYDVTDEIKINVISGISKTRLYYGKKTESSQTVTADDMLRITVNAFTCGVYTSIRKILIEFAAEGGSINDSVKIESATIGDQEAFTVVGTYAVWGNSGWNSIPYSNNFGAYSLNQSSNVGVLRFTFSTKTAKGNPCVQNLILSGITNYVNPSTLSTTGHLYSYDYQQNAVFPAKLTATSFKGDGSALTNIPYPVKSVNTKTGEVVLIASDVGAVSTDNVTTTLGTSTTKVPSEKAVSDALSAAGAGDMLKSVYDPNGDVATAGGIKAYADTKLPLTGGTVTGNVVLEGKLMTESENAYVKVGGNSEAGSVMLFSESSNRNKFVQVLASALAGYGSIKVIDVSNYNYQNELKITPTETTIKNVVTPTANGDAVPKSYADTKLPKSGGTMTGNLDMGDKKLQNLPTPTANGDAAPKIYVDAQKPALYSCTLEKTSWTGDNVKTLSLTLAAVLADVNQQLIMVTPTEDSREMYYACGVHCTGQGSVVLYFAADTLPTADLVVNIVILPAKAGT